MIIALLLQAALATQPAEPSILTNPEAFKEFQVYTQRRFERSELSYRCRAHVIQAMEPRRTVSESPVWVPGANPDEGWYAAVDRKVDGCHVPTPISLRNAKPADAPPNRR